MSPNTFILPHSHVQHQCNFLKLYGIEKPIIGLSINTRRIPFSKIMKCTSRKNEVSEVTRQSEVTLVDGIQNYLPILLLNIVKF